MLAKTLRFLFKRAPWVTRFTGGREIPGTSLVPSFVTPSGNTHSPNVTPQRVEGPQMTYKNVLEHMKEKQFGFDREKLAEVAAPSALPDKYDAKAVIQEEDENGDMVDVELFVPPARSTATRMPPERTKGHSRGSLVDTRKNRAITFASANEMRCATILLASPDITEVFDQPPAIAYVDGEGKARKHTPDYLAVDRCGRKLAIAVKPRRLVEKSGIVDTIKRIKPILGNYADDMILLTERQLTQARASNAENILHANDCRIQSDCDRIMEMMAPIEGQVNAYQIANRFGDFALGMNAILCLVYDGILQLADPSVAFGDFPYVGKAHPGRLRPHLHS